MGVGVGVGVAGASLGAASSGTIGVPPPLMLFGPWFTRILVAAIICALSCSMPWISGSPPETCWSVWKITVFPDPPESRTIAP